MTAENATEEACFCCGQSAPVEQLARMLCHPEVAVCAGCAEWLATWRKFLVRAVPVLRTDDLEASMRFWVAAGFEVHRFDEDFASGEREGLEVHLVLDRPEGRDRGGAYIHARDVDVVHSAWTEAGLPVSEVRDEPWACGSSVSWTPAATASASAATSDSFRGARRMHKRRTVSATVDRKAKCQPRLTTCTNCPA